MLVRWQGRSAEGGASAVPHGDAAGHGALHGAPVEKGGNGVGALALLSLRRK